jgi:hypothetical protein
VGISLIRFPKFGLNLALYRGKLDREEFIRFISGLDAKDPANEAPWLTYLAPDLDPSGIDCAAFAEVKRILKPKVEVMAHGKRLPSALVSGSADTGFVADFWRALVGADREYAAALEVFSDLRAALDWLGLPPSAYAAVRDAVQGPAAKAEAGVGAPAEPPGGR